MPPYLQNIPCLTWVNKPQALTLLGGGYNKQEFKTIEAVLKGGAKLNACEIAEVKTKQTNKQKTHCIS